MNKVLLENLNKSANNLNTVVQDLNEILSMRNHADIVPEKICARSDRNKKGSRSCLFLAKRQKSACCDLGFRTHGTKLLAEFLDATGGVDDLVLAGVERVRFSRYLDLHERVFRAFVGDLFTGLDGRTGDEFEVARQVVEHNIAVIWVDIFTHGLASLVLVAKQHFVDRLAS